MHRIKRVQLELTTDTDPTAAAQLLNRSSRLHTQHIAPLLNRVFDDVASTRLDRLIIDIGTISLENFEDELIIKLEPALRAALTRALDAAGRPDHPKVALELLELFAHTGNLLWWADDSHDPVAEALAVAIHEDAPATLKLLRSFAGDPTALTRLARHCDDTLLARLVGHTSASASAVLLALIETPARAALPRWRPALLAALARPNSREVDRELDAVVSSLVASFAANANVGLQALSEQHGSANVGPQALSEQRGAGIGPLALSEQRGAGVGPPALSGQRGAGDIVGGRRAGRRSGSRATAASPGHMLAASRLRVRLDSNARSRKRLRLRVSPGAPPPASHAFGLLVDRAALTAPRSFRKARSPDPRRLHKPLPGRTASRTDLTEQTAEALRALLTRTPALAGPASQSAIHETQDLPEQIAEALRALLAQATQTPRTPELSALAAQSSVRNAQDLPEETVKALRTLLAQATLPVSTDHAARDTQDLPGQTVDAPRLLLARTPEIADPASQSAVRNAQDPHEQTVKALRALLASQSAVSETQDLSEQTAEELRFLTARTPELADPASQSAARDAQDEQIVGALRALLARSSASAEPAMQSADRDTQDLPEQTVEVLRALLASAEESTGLASHRTQDLPEQTAEVLRALFADTTSQSPIRETQDLPEQTVEALRALFADTTSQSAIRKTQDLPEQTVEALRLLLARTKELAALAPHRTQDLPEQTVEALRMLLARIPDLTSLSAVHNAKNLPEQTVESLRLLLAQTPELADPASHGTRDLSEQTAEVNRLIARIPARPDLASQSVVREPQNLPEQQAVRLRDGGPDSPKPSAHTVHTHIRRRPRRMALARFTTRDTSPPSESGAPTLRLGRRGGRRWGAGRGAPGQRAQAQARPGQSVRETHDPKPRCAEHVARGPAVRGGPTTEATPSFAHNITRPALPEQRDGRPSADSTRNALPEQRDNRHPSADSTRNALPEQRDNRHPPADSTRPALPEQRDNRHPPADSTRNALPEQRDGRPPADSTRNALPEQRDNKRPSADSARNALPEQQQRGRARLEDFRIPDAGLVLLSPFLARLFERTALLNEDGQFLMGADMQAIKMLAYLAAGDPEPAEYDIPLAKLLCGLRPDSEVQAGEPPTPGQLGECDLLLAAVRDHAPVLRDMSPNELRAAFLRRPALLGVRDGAWLLRVERRPSDDLLMQLPWKWSWIKLPWMSVALQVEW